MFASDHSTPSEQRPAPPRAAPPRVVARPTEPRPGPPADATTPPIAAAPGPPALPSASSGTATGAAAARPALDARAPAHLRTLPSWLLSQASATAAQLVDDALAADGLRRQDYRVLVAIHEAGAASQADLGRAVWLDRSDLHGVVIQLETAGLVARERDPADRRRNVVTLTALGESTLAELSARVEAAQNALLAPLSGADRDTFVRLLQSLVLGIEPEATP